MSEQEEVVGCPPVASTSTPPAAGSKRAPKITVVKSDGTVAGEAPAAAAPELAGEAAVATEATAAVASAPKRRGRPKGSSNGKTAKPRVAPVSGEPYRVTAAIQLAADGPNGKVYFDRVLTGTGADEVAANQVLATELTEMYKTWEKIYLG